MMSENTPIINIFTYKLPKHLAKPMYTEFNNRYSEAIRIIDGYPKYNILKDDLATVELLLALSIFYKQVIANLDAATKFHGLVMRTQQADCISIGSYDLTSEEVMKIQSLISFFNRIASKYQVYDSLWNYSLTLDFLQRLINIKSYPDEWRSRGSSE